ncbi:hypothetical protein [Lyngbya aestuarii]|uniref:hypothetical protein n=1 Tax=Lyngbya aestuarii TaxID=118322 RepID=UPI00403D9102
MTVATLDPSKAEAFAARMFDILNSRALALITSIGHRTHLFDTMASLPPSTSEQIAQAASLNGTCASGYVPWSQVVLLNIIR